jgi:ABC-type uncharacterized transport system permease subunit
VPVSVLCTTAFSEVVMVAVVALAVGAEVSTVVVLPVVVPVVVLSELLEDSSFSPQEMMMRLKRDIRITCKIFFSFLLYQ